VLQTQAMTIEFTQYLRPNGRKRTVEIDRSLEVEALAAAFIAAGGWYECEELTTGHASLTACFVVDGESEDVVIELCMNGPAVPEHVHHQASHRSRQARPDRRSCLDIGSGAKSNMTAFSKRKSSAETREAIVQQRRIRNLSTELRKLRQRGNERDTSYENRSR
jgi:hypothetical protein